MATLVEPTTAETAESVRGLFQVMPDASTWDRDRLKESIREHHEQTGRSLWPGYEVVVDSDGRIVDGHQRASVCAELGLLPETRALDPSWSEDDIWRFAYRVNLARRHLSADDRRRLAAEYLRRYPTASTRTVAAETGINRNIAARVRRDLEEGGELDADDRPAHSRPSVTTVPDASDASEPDEDDEEPPDDPLQTERGADLAIALTVSIEMPIRNEQARVRNGVIYRREAQTFAKDILHQVPRSYRERDADGTFDGLRDFLSEAASRAWRDPEIRAAWLALP